MKMKIFMPVFLVLLLLTLATPTLSQSGRKTNDFIITGADAQRDITINHSQTLTDLVAQVEERFAVFNANTIHPMLLSAMPGSFDAALEQMPDRFLLEHANRNWNISLNYPIDLMDDSTAPQISGIESNTTGSGEVTIIWQTNEFADSEIMFGEQPGAYSQTASDLLYVKSHTVELTGLANNVSYYFKIYGKDQSGNTAESAEHTFTVEYQMSIYLPIILR